MAPNWNTQERGKNREDEDNDRATDYDAYSCMDLEGVWPNDGYGVEDTTMLHGLGLRSMESDEDRKD